MEASGGLSPWALGILDEVLSDNGSCLPNALRERYGGKWELRM